MTLSRTLTAALLSATVVSLVAVSGARAASLAVYLSGPNSADSDYMDNPVGNGILGTSFEVADGFVDSTTAGVPVVETSPVTVAGYATYQFGPSNRAGIVEDQNSPDNDRYGNGSGQFLAIGNFWNGNAGNQSVTVDFVNQERYFGLAWDAGDSGNVLQFYNGNTLLATYITSNTTSFLTSNPTFQSTNGATYNSSQYYGKPTTGQNTGEPYTYLNFFSSGFTFNRIVLGNVGASGFEQDNHRVSSQVLTPRGSFVQIENIVVVPEANTGVLASLALAGSALVGMVRRRRK